MEADGDADGDGDADEPLPDGDLADAEPDWEPGPTWVVQLEGREVHALEPTADGQVLVGGRSRGPWVARLDLARGMVWSRTFGSGNPAVELLEETDEGTIVVGAQGGFPGTGASYWLAELTEDGEVLWEQSFAAPASRAYPAGDGAYIVAGRDWDAIQVIRYSPDDGVLWGEAVSRPVGPVPYVLAAVGSGGRVFLVTSYTDDVWLAAIVLALDGDLVRADRGATRACGLAVAAIAPTEDGGLALAGDSVGLAVARIDAAGGAEWFLRMGRNDGRTEDPYYAREEGWAVAVGPAGEVLGVGLSAGTELGYGGYFDMYAVLADAAGDPVWARAIMAPGRPMDTRALAGAGLADGRWMVGGVIDSGFDGLLAALGASGDLDEPCSAVEERTYPADQCDFALEPLDDVTVIDGGIDLVDTTLLTTESSVDADPLCP